MQITLSYGTYFTHFSFLLFLIAIALPFYHPLKFFILFNSIMVGIVGNLLFINDYPYFLNWYKTTYPDVSKNDVDRLMGIGNFVFHTLPMIVALILLPRCTNQLHDFHDVGRFVFFEAILVLAWSLWPSNGQIVQNKMSSSYPNNQFLINVLGVSVFIIAAMLVFVQVKLKCM